MTAPHDGRVAAARLLGADDVPRGPIEPWAWSAFATLLLAGVGIAYLGLRPGGRAPIWVWLHGRFLLVALALALLLVGAVWSWLRRPFLQRRRGRAFLALLVVVGLVPLPMPYPSSFEHRPSGVPFVMPLRGEWVVHASGAAGGPLAAFTADRRFGLHLAKPEDLDQRADLPAHLGRAIGAQVLAPAAGTVAWVRADLPDRKPGQAARADVPELGNVVVLEVAEGQHLFLGHLEQGSVAVAPGDHVEPGRFLGRIGTSGTFRFTPVAHLSVHLQAGPDEGWGEPIPWSLTDYLADGVAVPRGTPRPGQRLRAAQE